MPAMYAHDTFGRKVATKLPLSVKQPILQYPQMFSGRIAGAGCIIFLQSVYGTSDRQRGKIPA